MLSKCRVCATFVGMYVCVCMYVCVGNLTPLPPFFFPSLPSSPRPLWHIRPRSHQPHPDDRVTRLSEPVPGQYPLSLDHRRARRQPRYPHWIHGHEPRVFCEMREGLSRDFEVFWGKVWHCFLFIIVIIYLSVRFVCLSVCLGIYVSVCLLRYLRVCLFFCLPVCSVCRPSV